MEAVYRKLSLIAIAVAWFVLVIGWWRVIPPHPFIEGKTERSKRLELLLSEQKQQVERTPDLARVIPPSTSPALAPIDPLIKVGRAVYQDFECNNCHKIGGEGWKKRKGPVLDNIGNLVTAEQLKEKLWNPMAWYAEGFEKEYKKVVMPDNYPEVMSEAERDALVAYMLTLKNTAVNTPKPNFDVERPE
jgi:cbb3-type cytochrome oxidase cytochrome c subunit